MSTIPTATAEKLARLDKGATMLAETAVKHALEIILRSVFLCDIYIPVTLWSRNEDMWY